MDSTFRTYLQSPKLNDFPGIEGLRAATSNKQFLDISFGIVQGKSDNHRAYPISGCYPMIPLEKTILSHEMNLLTATKFYYRGVDTWFGQRPFEIFILEERCRELGIRNRKQFFDNLAEWYPFLYELIIDTCNFILTGKRDIHIKILRDISIDYEASISNDREPPFPNLNVQQRFEWKDIEKMSSQEFFTRWVSQKHGIQDLICSYKVMLGL